ncbi:hypothetical protein DQ04_01931070 [Trypanosoma grayi]|uniref:hypothetical protein n=1 Tax=Trypanosoma grayi TaxID=71804 RepID=UPI0004F43B9C|nr:hypothetical protein DQ04_01931070 [Trypanosoma grayi]KEG12171.1 hypothetical protein DQ04_01931070 [Trypanosoma grayi]
MEEQNALKQEESDAAMARQLHEEINGSAATHQPTTGMPNQPSGIATAQCTVCTFVNTFSEVVPGTQYTCIQCHGILPFPTVHANADTSRGKQKLMNCTACHSLNRIPRGKFDAVLCGGCCRQLKDTPPSNEVSHPQVTPPATRRVQVRCGECSSINAVQVGMDVTDVRFECGSCQTINEVSL